MKHLLFPTDFSPTAQNAYIYALHIADSLKIDILTVHAFHPELAKVVSGSSIFTNDMFELEDYRQAAKLMHQQANQQHLAHIDVNHILEEGFAVDVALKVAERENVDLIVLGTKGANKLEEIFVGSTAANILEEAQCPVLAIPAAAHYKKIEHIVCPMNFQTVKLSFIRQIINFAALFNAKVTCFHVNEAHNPLLQNFKIAFEKATSSSKNISFNIVENDNVLAGINEFAEQQKADLLVMKTKKYSFIEKLFQISYTDNMISHTHIPLLALHETVEIL
ncbi:MAG: universal stress protein [Chitinophagales bacterium]